MAQDPDRQALSEEDIAGTARYVSLGGAMAAVGGDVSAVNDNPAALGLFRRGELSISFDGAFQRVSSAATDEASYKLFVPQLSWVANFVNAESGGGLLRHSLMLQFHNVRNFQRALSAESTHASSITEVMADRTNGLGESKLATNDVWYDSGIGWLSAAGYLDSLILPDPSDSLLWNPAWPLAGGVDNTFYSVESGGVNRYSVSWGANFSDRLYFGLSLALQSISYAKTSYYKEKAATAGCNLDMTTRITASGIGVGGSVGLIYRPVNAFRMGLGLRSPVWSNLRVSNRTDMKAYGSTYSLASPVNSYSIRAWQQPFHVTAGMAAFFSSRGFLSFEYDYQHQIRTRSQNDGKLRSAIPDVHQLKAGLEVVAQPNLFIRAGYACRSSFLRQDIVYMPAYEDTRTDVETLNLRMAHYASVGIGWRTGSWFVDAAYQLRIQQAGLYAHPFQEDPFELSSLTHRIVLSLGWTPRRR